MGQVRDFALAKLSEAGERYRHGLARANRVGRTIASPRKLAALVVVLAAEAGHGVALRGADVVSDPELREQLGALEAAGARGAWRSIARLDETIAETSPPIRSSRFPGGWYPGV